MPAVWITGAAGFIGTAVSKAFVRAGWNAVAIDRRPPERGHPLENAVVAGFISDAGLMQAYERTGPPRVVFHGAGTASVGRASANPVGAAADTVTSTETIVDFLSRRAPYARLIVPSSAAVYGNAGDVTLTEDLEPKPISLYGKLKLDVEKLCRLSQGPLATAIRFFSVYGPGLRKQLPWELGNRINKGESPITLFGTGNETRDFLHVDDAADLILRVATRADFALPVINGGSGTPVTVREFATTLAEGFGRKPEFVFNGVERPEDPKHYRADISRARELGWAPQITLKKGLADYAQWVKAQPE